MTETEALIALNQLPKTGPIKINRLLESFGSATNTLKQPIDQLTRVQGVGPEIAKIIHRWQDYCDPTQEIFLAKERGIQILTRDHEDYPNALHAYQDSPIVLYVWGNLKPQDQQAIAVVGSRKLTHYGRETARKFSYQLASAGLTIISGLARGIDTAAHEGALAAKGRTIAVLGSGLLQTYPPENLPLAEKISEDQGAVISEFPLQTSPDKQTFPQRNRIVAHWAQALLVVECPSRSGSLITANLASDAGKQIYAVPGPIDRPHSAGCHDLIRDGATLVTDGSQILDDFSHLSFNSPSIDAQPSPPETFLDLTKDENTVFSALSSQEQAIDDLVHKTSLPAHQVSVILMKLELRNLILNLPGQRSRRR